MLQTLVLLSLAAIAIARPNGSPICNVDTFDTSNHGGATSGLKYDIAVTPQGNKATIAINDQFIGLLLYVSDASGKHVGSLQSSSGDFKIATDCGGQSTITHSSSASKSGKFEWTGTETGPLTVNAIIMKDGTVWNVFKVPFQIGQSSTVEPTVEPTIEPSPTATQNAPTLQEPEVTTVNVVQTETSITPPSVSVAPVPHHYGSDDHSKKYDHQVSKPNKGCDERKLKKNKNQKVYKNQKKLIKDDQDTKKKPENSKHDKKPEHKSIEKQTDKKAHEKTHENTHPKDIDEIKLSGSTSILATLNAVSYAVLLFL